MALSAETLKGIRYGLWSKWAVQMCTQHGDPITYENLYAWLEKGGMLDMDLDRLKREYPSVPKAPLLTVTMGGGA